MTTRPLPQLDRQGARQSVVVREAERVGAVGLYLSRWSKDLSEHPSHVGGRDIDFCFVLFRLALREVYLQPVRSEEAGDAVPRDGESTVVDDDAECRGQRVDDDDVGRDVVEVETDLHFAFKRLVESLE